MKEISLIRLFRFSIIASIILTLIVFFLNIGIASAGDNGTLTINDYRNFSRYQYATSSILSEVDYTWFNASYPEYNSFLYLEMNTSSAIGENFVTYHQPSDFTIWDIVENGTGTGFVTYDSYLKTITWVCVTNCQFTFSRFRLSYQNQANFWANVTSVSPQGTNIFNAASPANMNQQPLCLSTNRTESCVRTASGFTNPVRFNTTVGASATITYNITYPYSGFFNAYITKVAGEVATKIKIDDLQNISYYIEPTFNNNNITNVLKQQGFGIALNLTVLNGNSTYRIINTSGSSVVIPNDINSNCLGGVCMVWEQNSYTTGSNAKLSWGKTTPLAACDNIKIYNKFNNIIATITNPADSGFYKLVLNSTGTWKAQYNRQSLCFITSEEVINTAYTTVTEPVTSYLVINSTTIAGRQENVTYRSGLISSFSPYLAVINSEGNPEGQFSISGYSINNEGVSPVVIVSSGQHVIKICDAFGCDPVVAVTNTIFNTSIPKINIATSNITLDKTSYQFEDTAIVSYSIDSLNFSNKAIIVTSYNWNYGIEQTRQVGLTNQTGSYEELFSLFLGRYSHTGQYSMRLVGRNQSGDYILAFWNFTILDIDSEGYKLTMSKSEVCKGETNTFVVMSPTTSYLNITLNTNGAVFNSYYINQSKTISYKPSYIGTYSVLLLSPEGHVKRAYTFDVKSCAVTPPSQDFQNGAAMEQKTDEFLSTGMFIVLIFLILFAGAGLEFGGVGGGIIGFGSGFLFLSIYGLIPLWALFLFAILIITVFSIFVATKTTSGGD